MPADKDSTANAKKDGTANMNYVRSANWAGFERIGQSTGATGYWYVPSVSSSAQTGHSSQWVGIGGGTSGSNTLAQTGTAAVKGILTTSYYPWYEIYGSNAVNNGYEVKITSFSVSAGDMMYADVYLSSISGSNATINFVIEDVTKGYSTTFNKTISITDNVGVNMTAEWISEDVSGAYPLTQTNGNNYVQFWNCLYQTDVNGLWTTLADTDSSIYEDDMYSSTNS